VPWCAICRTSEGNVTKSNKFRCWSKLNQLNYYDWKKVNIVSAWHFCKSSKALIVLKLRFVFLLDELKPLFIPVWIPSRLCKEKIQSFDTIRIAFWQIILLKVCIKFSISLLKYSNCSGVRVPWCRNHRGSIADNEIENGIFLKF